MHVSAGQARITDAGANVVTACVNALDVPRHPRLGVCAAKRHYSQFPHSLYWSQHQMTETTELRADRRSRHDKMCTIESCFHPVYLHLCETSGHFAARLDLGVPASAHSLNVSY